MNTQFTYLFLMLPIAIFFIYWLANFETQVKTYQSEKKEKPLDLPFSLVWGENIDSFSLKTRELECQTLDEGLFNHSEIEQPDKKRIEQALWKETEGVLSGYDCLCTFYLSQEQGLYLISKRYFIKESVPYNRLMAVLRTHYGHENKGAYKRSLWFFKDESFLYTSKKIDNCSIHLLYGANGNDERHLDLLRKGL